VGLRTRLDRCGKSRLPTGILSPDRPAGGQSLYRLSYSAHTVLSKPRYLTLIYQYLRENDTSYSTYIMDSHYSVKAALLLLHLPPSTCIIKVAP